MLSYIGMMLLKVFQPDEEDSGIEWQWLVSSQLLTGKKAKDKDGAFYGVMGGQ